MKKIRFDDVDALKAEISDQYGDWGPEFDVTQERINQFADITGDHQWICLLYTSPSPRDRTRSRMPSSA